jgi:hypothetical protein
VSQKSKERQREPRVATPRELAFARDARYKLGTRNDENRGREEENDNQ